MANAADWRIEFGYADLYAVYCRKLLPDIGDQVVGDVFEQAGGAFHDRRRNLVEGFIVDSGTQPVAAGRFRKVSKNGDVNGVFIANLLLLVVKTVIGKKLKSF